MNLLKNWKYHLFTFCFFVSIIFFFLTFKKLVYTDIYGTAHIGLYLFELLYTAALLYIISNVSIYFIEITCPTQILNFKNIMIVLGVIMLLHIAFQYVLWPSLLYAQHYFVAQKDYFLFTPQQTFNKRLVNYFYFLFISINWLAFIYAYKIYQTNQEELKLKLSIEKNLKEANLNTLKGQINPHFIFNSLNNIRGLVQEDPAKSKEMITRLSELLRSSLLSGKENTILLEQELETVENFLEISKIQYEDRLRFQIDAAPDTINLLVPPMILQMLVENAVKHGISILKDGGEILIKTYSDNNNLHLVVKNTGTLSTKKDTTRIGLKNIKERLRLLYDQDASFQLSESDNQVTAHIIINREKLNP